MYMYMVLGQIFSKLKKERISNFYNFSDVAMCLKLCKNTFLYISSIYFIFYFLQVAHIKDYLPQACPHGDSMILDCEVLMVDVKTGDPLPFGTLGIHKVTYGRRNLKY